MDIADSKLVSYTDYSRQQFSNKQNISTQKNNNKNLRQCLQGQQRYCLDDHRDDLKLHEVASDFSSEEPTALLGN